MDDNYDQSLPDGDVSEMKIFKEMEKNFNDESAPGQTVDVAGTCRHMHMLALNVVKRLGLKMALPSSLPNNNWLPCEHGDFKSQQSISDDTRKLQKNETGKWSRGCGSNFTTKHFAK